MKGFCSHLNRRLERSGKKFFPGDGAVEGEDLPISSDSYSLEFALMIDSLSPWKSSRIVL